MGRERSLSEVAAALEMPMNRLAYHVGRLLALRLIEVVRIQRRTGRPIRYYRAVADTFQVSAEAMGRGAGRGLSAMLEVALERAATIAGATDMVLSVDGEGRPAMRRLGGSASGEAAEYWRMLTLKPAEARALAAEMAALLARYETCGERGAAPFLAYAALARRP